MRVRACVRACQSWHTRPYVLVGRTHAARRRRRTKGTNFVTSQHRGYHAIEQVLGPHRDDRGHRNEVAGQPGHESPRAGLAELLLRCVRRFATTTTTTTTTITADNNSNSNINTDKALSEHKNAQQRNKFSPQGSSVNETDFVGSARVLARRCVDVGLHLPVVESPTANATRCTYLGSNHQVRALASIPKWGWEADLQKPQLSGALVQLAGELALGLPRSDVRLQLVLDELSNGAAHLVFQLSVSRGCRRITGQCHSLLYITTVRMIPATHATTPTTPPVPSAKPRSRAKHLNHTTTTTTPQMDDCLCQRRAVDFFSGVEHLALRWLTLQQIVMGGGMIVHCVF